MYKARFIINMLLARRVCGWSARQLLKPRPIRTAFKSSQRAAPLMSVVDKESMDYVDVDTELAAPVEDVKEVTKTRKHRLSACVLVRVRCAWRPGARAFFWACRRIATAVTPV